MRHEVRNLLVLQEIRSVSSGQNSRKAVCRSVFLTWYGTVFWECRINKNALLQTAFLRFCPLGITNKQ